MFFFSRQLTLFSLQKGCVFYLPRNRQYSESYNLKKNLDSKHLMCNDFTRHFRKGKVNDFKKIENQQILFKNASKNSQSTIKARFTIYKITTKHLEPFTNRELLKEWLLVAADIYFQINKNLLLKISLN